MQKLLEDIKTFGYKPPRDPELLLYDFYFMAGYMPQSHEDKVLDFVFKEAIKDCTDALQEHMLAALYWSLCAELRHIWSQSDLRSPSRAAKIVAAMPKDIHKFMVAYTKASGAYSSDWLATLQPDRKKNAYSKNRLLKNPLFTDNRGNVEPMSGRHEDYGVSFLAVEKARKSLKMTKVQAVECINYLYGVVPWDGSYGGKAWAKIADAYLKLAQASSPAEKTVYIDHAYDLQHNTGSVFTKVRGYYKDSSMSWLSNGLDWKRDATDVRGFYDKVSSSLKPVVAWVAKNQHGTTMEDYVSPETIARMEAEAIRAADKAVEDKIQQAAANPPIMLPKENIQFRIASIGTSNRKALLAVVRRTLPDIAIGFEPRLATLYLVGASSQDDLLTDYSGPVNAWLLLVGPQKDAAVLTGYSSSTNALQFAREQGQTVASVYKPMHCNKLARLEKAFAARKLKAKVSPGTSLLPDSFFIKVDDASECDEVLRLLEDLNPSLTWESGAAPTEFKVEPFSVYLKTNKDGKLIYSSTPDTGSVELTLQGLRDMAAKSQAAESPSVVPQDKYKVGDRVVVRPDLSTRDEFRDLAVTSEMAALAGKVVTISAVLRAAPAGYSIVEDNGAWFWAPEMFSGLAPEEMTNKGGSAVRESRDFHEFFKLREAVTMAQVGGKLLANASHFAKNTSLIQDFRISDLPAGVNTPEDLLYDLATSKARGRVLPDNIVGQLKNLQAKHGNLKAGISAWLRANPDANNILNELLRQGVTASTIQKADTGAVKRTGTAAQLQAVARRG